MVKHIFTEAELSEFDLDQLRILAKYYHVKWDKRTSKKKLLKLIYDLAVIEEHPNYFGAVGPDGMPEMSVRVRRLYELNKGKKDGS